MAAAARLRNGVTHAVKIRVSLRPATRLLPLHRPNLAYQQRRLVQTRAGPPNSFFHYDSGRWLWNEDAEFAKRYQLFDVAALKKAAARAAGSTRCVSMDKIWERDGRYFRLKMDDDNVVIVKIPTPALGPTALVTSSEVATMEFVGDVLDLPVPRVLAWSSAKENSVGCDYIIMAEADGLALGHQWQDMKLSVKDTIIQDLVHFQKKLISLAFRSYGALYFADHAPPGSIPVELEGDLKDSVRRRVCERYVIGPVVDKNFHDGFQSGLAEDRGPWTNAADYIRAATQVARNRVVDDEWLLDRHRFLGLMYLCHLLDQEERQNCRQQQERVNRIAQYIAPPDVVSSRATLWHDDLSHNNIFYKDGRLSIIVDWRGVWAGPLSLTATNPTLLRIPDNIELQLKLPDGWHTMQDKAEKKRIADQVVQSVLLLSYAKATRRHNPVLTDIHTRPQRDLIAAIMQRLFVRDREDLNMLRQALISIVNMWTEVAPDIECPMSFTEQEMDEHCEAGETHNRNLSYWDRLPECFNRYGYARHFEYGFMMDIFKNARNTVLNSTEGEDREDFAKVMRGVETGRSYNAQDDQQEDS